MTGGQTGLLEQFPGGGGGRILPRLIEQPSGQFPESVAQRMSILVDHGQPTTVIDGGDGDRAEVLDDLPVGIPAPGIRTSSTRNAMMSPR